MYSIFIFPHALYLFIAVIKFKCILSKVKFKGPPRVKGNTNKSTLHREERNRQQSCIFCYLIHASNILLLKNDITYLFLSLIADCCSVMCNNSSDTQEIYSVPLIETQHLDVPFVCQVARGTNTGGISMPMVLTIPRFFDPWGGSSIVGFGDVMMPGLLIAFSYRYTDLSDGYFRSFDNYSELLNTTCFFFLRYSSTSYTFSV